MAAQTERNRSIFEEEVTRMPSEKSIRYILRVMEPKEQELVFPREQETSETQESVSKARRIGFWTGSYDEQGNQCFFHWYEDRRELNCYEFLQNETGLLVGMNPRMLETYEKLVHMCRKHPQAAMLCHPNFYGFRITADEYSYLLVCQPDLAASFQFQIHCFRTGFLNKYLRQIQKGLATL